MNPAILVALLTLALLTAALASTIDFNVINPSHRAGLAGARADTIRDFVVSGTATNVSGRRLDTCAAGALCSFSGTMMVDVSATAACLTVQPRGCVTAYDITFPGVAPFICCSSQVKGAFGTGWLADSEDNIDRVVLRFDFTTTEPGSLVGFEGGSISGFDVVGPSFRDIVFKPQRQHYTGCSRA